MKTYNELFQNAQHPLLIPFFVIGDPNPQQSLHLIKAAIDAGADILELGIPFSDPIADGPTIQAADIRALNAGMNCDAAFDLIRQVKAYKDIPIGLLMYYNLIVHYGTDAFYRDAANAGVNSVLIADLSIDDAPEVVQHIQKNNLDTVFMVTPNTHPQRRRQIAQLCTGFVYTVSVMGVTGARNTLSQQIQPLIADLKSETQAPVCVGFGVSQPDHARQLALDGADGVIVGSALVKLIEQHLDNPNAAQDAITKLITDLKIALAT